MKILNTILFAIGSGLFIMFFVAPSMIIDMIGWAWKNQQQDEQIRNSFKK